MRNKIASGWLSGFVWLWATLLLGSCADLEVLRAKVDELEQRLTVREQSDGNQGAQLGFLRSDIDELSRLVGCQNAEVRNFMRSCVTRDSRVCTPTSVDAALKAMTTVEHVMAYQRVSGDFDFAQERLGRLKKYVREHHRLSTTRLLVVAAPAGTLGADSQLAEYVATKLRDRVAALYQEEHKDQSPLRVLPPLQLACKERDELMHRYQQALPNRDTPVLGEPTGKDKRIVLWFFLVDC